MEGKGGTSDWEGSRGRPLGVVTPFPAERDPLLGIPSPSFLGPWLLLISVLNTLTTRKKQMSRPRKKQQRCFFSKENI